MESQGLYCQPKHQEHPGGEGMCLKSQESRDVSQVFCDN